MENPKLTRMEMFPCPAQTFVHRETLEEQT